MSVHVQVKSVSQARAPQQSSHMRTGTHTQGSPIQQQLKFPYTHIHSPQNSQHICPVRLKSQTPNNLRCMVEREEKEGRKTRKLEGATKYLPEDPEQSPRLQQQGSEPTAVGHLHCTQPLQQCFSPGFSSPCGARG